MSVSSVASSTNASTLQSLYQQSKNAFKTLASDVQSGDMSGAQSALTALQQASASIQGLGSSSGTQQPSQSQAAFANLISSIQAGSTSGAQSVLGALESATSATAATSTTGAAGTAATGSTQSSLGQDLASLIQAVQSGNLSGAQQDLTQLQSDATSQVSGHHHHHHHGGGDVANATASNASTANSSNAAGSSTSTSTSASAYAAVSSAQVPMSSITVFA